MRRRLRMNRTVGAVGRLGAMLVVAVIFAWLGKRLATELLPTASARSLPREARMSPTMDVVEWKTVEAPAWLTDTEGDCLPSCRDDYDDQSMVFILLRAKDCLTCLDLGRRLRVYARNSSATPIRIVTRREDSASVGRFLRQEKVGFISLILVADEKTLLPISTGQLPAMITRRTRRNVVDLIELRWTIADTASFAGLLDRRQVVRPQKDTLH